MNLLETINHEVNLSATTSYMSGVSDAMSTFIEAGVSLYDVRIACDEVNLNQGFMTSEELPATVCKKIATIALEIAHDRQNTGGAI